MDTRPITTFEIEAVASPIRSPRSTPMTGRSASRPRKQPAAR